MGNLNAFRKEFIAAGCRNSVIGLYRKLVEHGASPVNKDNDIVLLSSKADIVLLCKNNGINKVLPQVQILKKNWWSFYHNRKLVTSPKLPTYNVPRQTNTILEDLAIFTEIETLIPE